MCKILLICHDVPSMTVGATLPLYHLIKNMGNDHELDLISFDSGKYDIENLEGYLNNHYSLKNPEYLSIKDQLIYTLKNMFCIDNLHTRSFLNYYYRKDMNELINKHVKNYDVIITDMPMAFYVKNQRIPKIVYAFDAVSDYNYRMYEKASGIVSKIYWYLNYLKIHHYELVYNHFDSCIVVNQKDKELLYKYIKTPITVVANGVDTKYFTNNNDFNQRIVFLGDMSTPPNNDAVRYFMEEIYPSLIKQKDIDFYIVGRNPTSYIQNLSNDSIYVTGSVDDVREYLTRGSIFITPMVSGTGIKNKILEAMSMQLCVVSTAIGISGIDATDDKEFLLADNAIEFKNQIIRLMDDVELQSRISTNARLFVEKNYSWDSATKTIESIIDEIKK